MKIVCISVGSMRVPPTQGGAPLQVLFNTSKHLAKMGHEVIILDSRYSREDASIEYSDDLKIVRLNSPKIPVVKSSKMPRYIRFVLNELETMLFAIKVSRYLTKNSKNIDVIHIHLTSVGLILSILNRKLRSKMFYTSHLGQWVLRGTKKLTALERVHISFDAYLMKRVARVIALNELAKDNFVAIGKVKPENVTVIHNGVDTQFFNPTIDAEAIKKKYDLEGKLAVLFVGQLTKIKGVEYLIKAADIIINEFGYKNLVFILVGPLTFGTLEKPIDMEKVLAYIRDHDLESYIIFTGALPLEEVRRFYVACDIFVMPSLAETGPLVTLEAMASGKPIIGTKVGAMPTQIKHGWNGFIVDPGDEKQLADKMKYLIDKLEDRERMGTNSRKYIEDEFDWRKVAEKLLEVYRN